MNHKDMDVWEKSVSLVESVYKLTQPFPKEEQYGLTSRFRQLTIKHAKLNIIF